MPIADGTIAVRAHANISFMGNDNKKINSLSDGPDDDPTLELVEPEDSAPAPTDAKTDPESGASTFDADDTPHTDDGPSQNISTLQSDLHTRNESISKLQFDIELLRSRWTGLEKEIRAREQLTENVNAELTSTRTRLANAERALEKGQSEIGSLRESIETKDSELQRIATGLEEETSAAEQLRQTEANSQARIESLESELQAVNASASEHTAEFARLEGQFEEQVSTSEDFRRRYEDASAKISDFKRQIRDQRQELDRLKTELNNDSGAQERRERRLIAEQDGQLTSSRLQISELEGQLGKTEDYADSIRIKLKNALKDSETAENSKRQIQASLGSALGQISELREQYQTEHRARTELEKTSGQLKEQFDQEARQIRFELGSAQETIAGQESINEQLASDLIDNQGFRQALESQLEKADKQSSRKTQELSRELRKLKQLNDDLEHKIANKDNSIAALLSELASRSRTIESIGEIENVIHEIDGRMSDRIDDKDAVDRTTRLLIGSVDGQELRFPLFKDRLTVGRTSRNDIQLNAQHISRRHAVIETDNDKTTIVDWGSKNGVFVNEIRVTEQELHNGDIVSIGTADFRYEERPKR